jgi:predicted small secreted protein
MGENVVKNKSFEFAVRVVRSHKKKQMKLYIGWISLRRQITLHKTNTKASIQMQKNSSNYSPQS